MSEAIHGLSLGASFEALSVYWQVSHALERSSRRLETLHGLSSLQRWMLRAIGKYPGITPGQLAELFFLDAGSITFTLNNLEKKKLISRRRISKDKRRITMGLTAAGRKLDAKLGLGVEIQVLTELEKDLKTRDFSLHALAQFAAKLSVAAENRSDCVTDLGNGRSTFGSQPR